MKLQCDFFRGILKLELVDSTTMILGSWIPQRFLTVAEVCIIHFY